MPYQTFSVEITSLPAVGDVPRARIRVESPVGEASAEVNVPFTAAEIERYLAILGKTTPDVTRAMQTPAARELGERLFNFALRANDAVYTAFVTSLERVGTNGLRVRFAVENAGMLAALPWELLRDAAYGRDYLALSRGTPIVRYPAQITLRQPLDITLPLRVLIVLSSPANFPALDVEGEWERLLTATAEIRARGLLEIVRLEHASLIDLQRELRARDYHIFHYIGHSDFDAATQQGVIVLESEADPERGQIIGGQALGRELAEETCIRLAVINSCHSARRPDQDVLAGIASGLVARGIPAVIAMQFAISDGAAKIFAEELYRAIAEGFPIDTAVSEGRRAIANRQPNSIEWATPILYLRADDGVLFNATPSESSPHTQPAAPPVVPPNPFPRVGALLIVGVMLVALLAAIALPLINPTPTPTLAPTVTLEPTTPPLLPDLQVASIRTSPSLPAPGEIFRVSITITNAGAADSGAFNYSWDASLGDPLLQNSFSARVDNIPAGASKNISFPYSYGWWGSYNTLVNIDADAEVRESNKRNNSLPHEIDLQLVPFAIDFSLLPSNEIVEPPFTLPPDEYDIWNLQFRLETAGASALSDEATPDADCTNTALALVENPADADDIMMTADDAALPECAALPLVITILRRPVSDATIEVTADQAALVTVTYYQDTISAHPIDTTAPQALAAGETAAIFLSDATRLISRIDIVAQGQPVRLTGLSLSPPPP